MKDHLQALNSRGPHGDERGFSLFELMFVVLIIGVLVSVAVLILGASTATSRNKACQANLRIINGAINQYEAEGMGAPSSIALLVAVGFIKRHRTIHIPDTPNTLSSAVAPNQATTTKPIHNLV